MVLEAKAQILMCTCVVCKFCCFSHSKRKESTQFRVDFIWKGLMNTYENCVMLLDISIFFFIVSHTENFQRFTTTIFQHKSVHCGTRFVIDDLLIECEIYLKRHYFWIKSFIFISSILKSNLPLTLRWNSFNELIVRKTN